ncbi:MAG: NAD(P)-dependent oxidoreductase [Clostridiales bacterium]|nr:NAD(P)-dependent oxidoreductase [Clostridiales bacterium]
MKIFVTGGTGFIGSYVVKSLLDNGHEITVYAKNPQKVSGFINRPKLSFVQGAMSETGKFTAGVANHDALIHIALAWGDTPSLMLENETLPSVRLFEAAAEAGVKKIVYTSSIAAFGAAPDNDMGYIMPMDYYGATKASAEAYLMAIGSQYNIKVNAVRPGYTFGNPSVEGGFIYSDKKIKNMVKAALANESMQFVKNDGTQFIWAGDLAKIYTALIESDLSHGYYTGVSADFRTWGQVAGMVIDITGSKSVVEWIDRGQPEHKTLPINISRIKEAFGFEFRTDEKMMEHIKYLLSISC